MADSLESPLPEDKHSWGGRVGPEAETARKRPGREFRAGREGASKGPGDPSRQLPAWASGQRPTGHGGHCGQPAGHLGPQVLLRSPRLGVGQATATKTPGSGVGPWALCPQPAGPFMECGCCRDQGCSGGGAEQGGRTRGRARGSWCGQAGPRGAGGEQIGGQG